MSSVHFFLLYRDLQCKVFTIFKKRSTGMLVFNQTEYPKPSCIPSHNICKTHPAPFLNGRVSPTTASPTFCSLLPGISNYQMESKPKAPYRLMHHFWSQEKNLRSTSQISATTEVTDWYLWRPMSFPEGRRKSDITINLTKMQKSKMTWLITSVNILMKFRRLLIVFRLNWNTKWQVF